MRTVSRNPSAVASALWCFIWFFVAAVNAATAVFLDKLYLVSAVSVIVICLTAFAAYMVSVAELRNVFPLRFNSVTSLVILLNVVALVSVITSPVTFENKVRVYGNLAAGFSLQLIVLTLSMHFDHNPQDAIRKLALWFLLGSAITSVAPFLVTFQMDARYGFDVILHPNAVGFRAALALLFILCGLWGFRRGLIYVGIVFFVIILLLTFSKTSLLALGVSVTTLWLLSGWKQKSGLFFALVLFALFLGHLMVSRVLAYLSLPDAQTMSGRLLLWPIVWQLGQERAWLGWGFDSFREVLIPLAPSIGWMDRFSVTHAHNAYLNVFVQTGYLGLGLLVMLLIAILVNIWRWNKLHASTASRCGLLVWVFMFVRSWTEGSFGQLGFELALLVAFGALAREALIEKSCPLAKNNSDLAGFAVHQKET